MSIKKPSNHQCWTDPTGAATSALLQISHDRSMKGARHVRGNEGEGCGMLVFLPNGKVWVGWDELAAIASAHSSGKTSNPPTESTGNREPVKLSHLFDLVSSARRVGRQGFEFPKDHEGLAILKNLELFQELAWRMVRAVGTGNPAELRAIADSLEKCDAIHSGTIETPTAKWRDIAEAISRAAEATKRIPTRAEIKAELFHKERGIAVNAQTSDIRDTLGRMGFGWIPAPNGRPKEAN